MKIFVCAFVNLILVLQLIEAANLPRKIENVRVKREDDDQMAAIVAAGAGLATSFMDVASKGGAAKDERDFQADVPFAKFKSAQKSGVEQYRRRKRSPCGKRKNSGITTTTVEPPPADAEGAERRKRQAVNDPDNVRPKMDGNNPMQGFLDSFVEVAKKIGNLFVPSDPNNAQSRRQQEMDDRF